jgi:hypothetical protein
MLMYKTIFLIKKTKDEQVPGIIRERIIPSLNLLFNQDIQIGKIENNLLNEVNYDLCFEISCKDKETFDRLMNSPDGKSVNKDLAGIFNDVIIYSINFDGDK